MFRGSRLSGALLVAAVLTVLGFRVRTVSYAQPNDEAQIRALEDHFAAAFRAKDVDGITANHEHSRNLAVFDVVPRREYLGWDAYKKDWEDFFAPIDAITLFAIPLLQFTP